MTQITLLVILYLSDTIVASNHIGIFQIMRKEDQDTRLPEPLKKFVHRLSSHHVPSIVQEALSNPKWSQAIKAEMEALEKSKTWALVPLLKGKKIVGCKWVFSIKHKVDGSIERYKARLVAKGYTQKYGID